jgi:hypothetical protein
VLQLPADVLCPFVNDFIEAGVGRMARGYGLAALPIF